MKLPSHFHRAFVVLLFGMCCAIVGCGKQTGTVTGKVTYQGKILKGGTVTFQNTESGERSFSSEIQEDGSYTVQDAFTGAYKVCVSTSALRPASGAFAAPPTKQHPNKASDADIPAGGSNPRAQQEARNIKRYKQIPEDYSKPDKTDLSYTVVSGAQTHDIELK
jgi:hypothetical protein